MDLVGTGKMGMEAWEQLGPHWLLGWLCERNVEPSRAVMQTYANSPDIYPNFIGHTVHLPDPEASCGMRSMAERLTLDAPWSPPPPSLPHALMSPFTISDTRAPRSLPCCDTLLKPFPLTSHAPAYPTVPGWVWMKHKDYGLIIGGGFP